MRIELMTLAEILGIASVLLGGWLVWNLGGLVLGLGAVLLYEAKT